jgi:hypothetical protein
MHQAHYCADPQKGRPEWMLLFRPADYGWAGDFILQTARRACGFWKPLQEVRISRPCVLGSTLMKSAIAVQLNAWPVRQPKYPLARRLRDSNHSGILNFSFYGDGIKARPDRTGAPDKPKAIVAHFPVKNPRGRESALSRFRKCPEQWKVVKLARNQKPDLLLVEPLIEAEPHWTVLGRKKKGNSIQGMGKTSPQLGSDLSYTVKGHVAFAEQVVERPDLHLRPDWRVR